MIDGLSVLAVITARGGSKGLPGKNILPIGGKPLIAWTIEAARASSLIDRLVLSSDDAAIIEAARRHGCDVPFVREAALATDTASSVDVVADALARVIGHDIVVLLQPTSPLRTAEDIDATLTRLISSGAPACVTVREAEDHPYWTFELDVSGHMQRYAEPVGGIPARRQDLPQAWCLNGAVYAARIEWFLEQQTFLSSATVAQPMPASRSLDIDTPQDLQRLLAMIPRASAPYTPNKDDTYDQT